MLASRISGDFKLVFRICARTGDDGFHLGLLSGKLVEISVFLAIGRINFFQPGFGSEHIAHTGLNAFAHGLGRIELRLLRQIPNSQIGHGYGLAFDLLVQTRHNSQQRGFTGSIGAEHANFCAGEEAKRDILKNESLGRHHLADAVH